MHKIGVLDSGIGGLTTCFYILQQNPHINILYYADNKNAPYGNKTREEVLRAVMCGVDYLLEQRVELIVIACNTATAVAISAIRQATNIPVVGTEPEMKNANNDALILATRLTQKSKGVCCQNFDTKYLASVIENCYVDEGVFRLIANKINCVECDEIVLGCTHYIFLKPYIKKKVLDGGVGVSRRVICLLPTRYDKNRGRIILHFSGKKEFSKYLKSIKALENFFNIPSK